MLPQLFEQRPAPDIRITKQHPYCFNTGVSVCAMTPKHVLVNSLWGQDLVAGPAKMHATRADEVITAIMLLYHRTAFVRTEASVVGVHPLL